MKQVDHIVFAATDLGTGIEHVERLLGVRAAIGGRHPQWGTHNAVLSLGSGTYLEIIAADPGAEDGPAPVLFGLDRLRKPGLVAWAAPERDIDARAAGAARSGIQLGEPLEGTRRAADGSILSWRLTDPMVRLHDGIVPFFIDWGRARHPSIEAPGAGRLVDLRATHPDPDGVGRALAALRIDLRVTKSDSPGLIATIEGPSGAVELS